MLKSNRGPKSTPMLFENLAVEWMSTNDVAKFLSVSPNSVRIMVCRGILPAFRLRGRLRFRKKDCAALIDKKGA
jgi:hypothetical protein